MDITICLWILAIIHFIVGGVATVKFIIGIIDETCDKDELLMFMFFGAWGIFVWWVLVQAITVINILLP